MGLNLSKQNHHIKMELKESQRLPKNLGLKSQDIVIDVQGDEPLIDPVDIDKTIKFFLKNNFDIVVPHINLNKRNNHNIVKILVDNKKILNG